MLMGLVCRILQRIHAHDLKRIRVFTPGILWPQTVFVRDNDAKLIGTVAVHALDFNRGVLKNVVENLTVRENLAGLNPGTEHIEDLACVLYGH